MPFLLFSIVVIHPFHSPILQHVQHVLCRRFGTRQIVLQIVAALLPARSRNLPVEIPAVLVQCGVGKVNAARGTQMLIDAFGPCCVINSGIAGGTKPGLAIGDIVIGEDLAQHDFDVTAFGYALGYMCTGENSSEPTRFTAESVLVEELEQAARTAAPERGVHRGRIVSGDQFISGAEKKKQLREAFNAVCAEMESAAIAQTCQYAGVPFGILRVISDLADGTAPESYDRFERTSADLSAAVILEFLKIHRKLRAE